MSNYKSYDLSFNELCSYFTDSNITSNYYKNTNIVTKASDFTSIIEEKPNSLGYSYNKDGNNIDISLFSIAKYIEKSGNFTISNTDIPSWCTKIRAVLVGAGGSGAIGSDGKNTYEPAVNINKLNKNVYEYQRQNEKKKNLPGSNTQTTVDASTPAAATELAGNNAVNIKNYAGNDGRLVSTHNINTTYTITQQTNTIANNTQQAGTGGAGGGGGGFIYLNDIEVFGKTLTVQSSGGNITLSIGNGNSVTVTKGGDASGNDTVGSVGTTTTLNLNVVAYNGTVGSKATDINGGVSGKSKLSSISSSLLYGDGGNGGNGGTAPLNVTKDVSGNNGGSGNSSFCRIYFLTQ
jgi:hypothetical protein